MTTMHFNEQMRRLTLRFGPKAFDEEFKKLVWKEVHDVGDYDFTRMIDVFVGTRPHTKPPVLVDFREGRLKIEKNNFNRDVAGAASTMFDWAKQKGLKAFLAENYPGCNSLWDAVQIERERLRAREDEIPF